MGKVLGNYPVFSQVNYAASRNAELVARVEKNVEVKIDCTLTNESKCILKDDT